jgi:hypothetical protein
MSRQAPPPRNGTTTGEPTDAQKAEAAAKVAAAFQGDGFKPGDLSPETGAVSAEAIQERAKTRSRKPAAPKTEAPAEVETPPDGAVRVESSSNLSKVLLDMVDALNTFHLDLKAEIADAKDAVLRHGDNTRLEFGEGLRVLLESIPTEVTSEPTPPTPEPLDHEAIRVVVLALPKESEWLDEWATNLAKKRKSFSAERLMDTARLIGAVEVIEGADGGEVVCAEIGMEG